MKNIDLKKILKYLIIFTILCIILFYANSLNVKAETITIGAPKYTIYQNNGTSHTYTGSSIDFWGKDFWRGASNFGVVSSDVSFDTQEFFYTNSNWCVGKSLNVSGYIAGVYDFFANGGTVQVFNNNKAMTCTYSRENSSLVKYSCVGEGGGTFKIAMYRNNASFSYDTGISKSIELSCDDTLTNVIENDKNNTNAIIDNQNKNNEELKDTIDDSLNNCVTNIFNIKNYTSSNFNSISFSQDKIILSSETSWSTTSYDFNVEPNEIYTLYFNSSSNAAVFFQNSSGNYQSVKSGTFTQITPSSSNLNIRLQNTDPGSFTFSNLFLAKGVHNHFTPYGEKKCTSKLDDTNDKLDDLNSNLTDSSDPNLAIGDVAGWLPPGPVDSVLNLPLTILNSLITNLSNRTCTSVDLPLPYVEQTIQLPCLSTIFNQTGFTDVLNTISIPFAIFIYINTLIKLYGWVDETLQFREEHWNDVDQWGGI